MGGLGGAWRSLNSQLVRDFRHPHSLTHSQPSGLDLGVCLAELELALVDDFSHLDHEREHREPQQVQRRDLRPQKSIRYQECASSRRKWPLAGTNNRWTRPRLQRGVSHLDDEREHREAQQVQRRDLRESGRVRGRERDSACRRGRERVSV